MPVAELGAPVVVEPVLVEIVAQDVPVPVGLAGRIERLDAPVAPQNLPLDD